MTWGWINTKKNQEFKQKETIQDFLSRGGAIRVIEYGPGLRELEFPIFPKGRKLFGQDCGCLRIPSHGVA